MRLRTNKLKLPYILPFCFLSFTPLNLQQVKHLSAQETYLCCSQTVQIQSADSSRKEQQFLQTWSAQCEQTRRLLSNKLNGAIQSRQAFPLTTVATSVLELARWIFCIWLLRLLIVGSPTISLPDWCSIVGSSSSLLLLLLLWFPLTRTVKIDFVEGPRAMKESDNSEPSLYSSRLRWRFLQGKKQKNFEQKLIIKIWKNDACVTKYVEVFL